MVELSMLLEMDNSGAVDIANSWSVGGIMCHVDVHNDFLHELMDYGLLIIRHLPGDNNDADIFMKNVMSAVFNHHVPHYVGIDEYIQASSGRLQRVIFVLELIIE